MHQRKIEKTYTLFYIYGCSKSIYLNLLKKLLAVRDPFSCETQGHFLLNLTLFLAKLFYIQNNGKKRSIITYILTFSKKTPSAIRFLNKISYICTLETI